MSYFMWRITLVVLAITLACGGLNITVPTEAGTFWHITDVHAQPDYKKDSSIREHCIKGKGRAGEFGSDYACDTPKSTIDRTFYYMTSYFQDPDFIIYTGDWMPYENYKPLDQFSVVEYQKAVASYFLTYFGGSNTRVFPVLGDIDTLPQHQMYPYSYWLYQETAEAWKDLIQDPIAVGMFSAGGFYDTLISPQLRYAPVD
ncbi:hypothetical protein Pelo_5158 [Pelomyxa schiedti]|nr:hypothetical protein Pelo_5158 [Pelomyxa schiedti]